MKTLGILKNKKVLSILGVSLVGSTILAAGAGLFVASEQSSQVSSNTLLQTNSEVVDVSKARVTLSADGNYVTTEEEGFGYNGYTSTNTSKTYIGNPSIRVEDVTKPSSYYTDYRNSAPAQSYYGRM